MDEAEEQELRRRLREAEARLAASDVAEQALLDAFPNPIIGFEPESLRIRLVNAAVTKQYGFSRDELLSMTIAGLRPEEEIGKMMQEVRNPPRPNMGIWRHRRKDGSLVDVEVFTQEVTLQGRVLRLSTVIDVTERLRAERKFAEEHLRLRTLLANAPVVVYATDVQGRFTLSEGLGLAAVGLESGQLVGTDARDVFGQTPFRDAAGNSQTGADVLARVLGGDEYSGVSNLGEAIFANRILPLRDERGAVAGLIGVATDVSDSHKAEAEAREREQRYRALFEQQAASQTALRESEARFRAAFQTIPDAITIVRVEDGAFIAVNEEFCRLTGWSQQEILSARAPTLGIWAEPDARAAFIERLMRERYVRDFETRFRTRAGLQLTVLVSSSLFETAGKLCYLTVIRDMTERRRMESQLMAADRMASVGTLAAGVAHEINNPLAYVFANLTVAVEALTGLPDPRVRESVEALREALEGAERVRQIVRDLKAFSRTDDTPAGPVDVHQVLDASINMAWNEIRHRARLLKDYQLGLPRALGNEPRLGQVFLNLLINAAQAIPEGDAAGNQIRLGTRAAGGQVIVEVRDTGSGIAAEDLPRLFDPFFTTKPVGVGTGLGLFVCQGIVRSLGGDLTVESEPGKGSAFRVSLPAAPEAARASLPAQALPAAAIRRGRILAVDDEPLVGTALVRALGAHDVVIATSAVEALERLRAGEQFDVIFCDLMMPDMTGVEFHAAMERELPALLSRVIFLTGGAFTPGAREFLEQSSARTLEKPFNVKTIRALVAAELDRAG